MSGSSNPLRSLNGIFSDSIFRIPDYQRGYSWGSSQLSDFWEDLVNLPDGQEHYTGMLTIKTVKPEEYEKWPEDDKWIIGDKMTPYYVVDGQQRLTTFIIFVQCFIELMRSVKSGVADSDIDVNNMGLSDVVEKLSDVVEKYIYAKKRNSLLCAYKFGYEVDGQSADYLQYVILNKENCGHIVETFYTANLDNAKAFFKKNLEAYYKEHNEDGILDLFKKATTKLKFNIYTIDDGFDVFSAFETMNNRGKPLSYLELLKSRLIYLTSLFSADQIDAGERDKLRKEINDAWREIYFQLGRNKAHPLSDDEFLRAHWIMNYQFSKKRGGDYASFLLGKEFIPRNVFDIVSIIPDEKAALPADDFSENDEGDYEEGCEESQEARTTKITKEYISEYAGSLKRTSAYWYATHYPYSSRDITEDEKLWLDRLNRIGMAYFRPLIVASYISPNSNSDSRIDLFREIERFIFISFRMCGAYASYNQSQIYTVTRQICHGEKSLEDAIRVIHNRLEGWVHPETVFDQKPFASRIQRLYNDGHGYYYWGGLRYFLYEYEMNLKKQSKAQHAKLDWDSQASIEHIFPQTPADEYWVERFGSFSDEQKAKLTGSLGNLLLLSVSKNSTLQNDSYPQKRTGINENGKSMYDGYNKGSFSENEVAAEYDDWDAKSICQRGMTLLKFMEKRWNIHFKDEGSMKELLFLDFLE